MNSSSLRGSWEEMKGQIKERWGKLTNDQLLQSKGNLERLKGEIRRTYGYTEQEAKREYEDFLRSLNK